MTHPPLKPFYLFYGNQDLLIQEALENCIENLLENRDREWAYERYNLADLLRDSSEEASQLVDDFLLSCETLPMFSDRKIFRLDHAELLKKTAIKGADHHAKRLFDHFLSFLSSPPPHLYCVFSSSATREQDFSKPLLSLFQKQGQVQKFVVYDNQNPLQWLLNRSRGKDINLHPHAAQTLIEIVGNDLNDLDQELEKLKVGLGEGVELTEVLIRDVVRGHKHASVFRMTEALAYKKLNEALENLDQQLRESPRDHVRLFSLIIFHYRRLLTVHYLLEQNLKETVLAGKIKLPPFLAKQVLKQARNYNCLELERIMLELSRLDLDIKFHGSLGRMILVNLFEKICKGEFREMGW